MILWPNQSLGILLTIFWKRGHPFKTNRGTFWLQQDLDLVILCADIEKAILQILIKEKDRESLTFPWVENLTNNTIQILRFTRLVFGLSNLGLP